MFSYLDTQINLFGGPNWHQLPINQARQARVRNHQQDGPMRYGDQPEIANYNENTRGYQFHVTSREQGGFTSHPEQMQGQKVQARSETFGDHFSQATLFWNSMSPAEKEHIVEAFRFELGKVTLQRIQERMLDLIANVDEELAALVAQGLGLPAPKPGKVNQEIGRTSGLSQMEGLPAPVKSRMVAVLAADGVNVAEMMQMCRALDKASVKYEVIAPHGGFLQGNNGSEPVQVDKTSLTALSQHRNFAQPGKKLVAA